AGQPPETDGWDLFARVKFEAKYIKEANSYFLAPVFDQKIISLAGTEITLKGYYMPMETEQNQLIISKNPYASCFFCGGAGPESVAEALLKEKSPRLKVDQIITVKGKLKLNDKDVNHMNFILVDAEIITE
ncbi:MAG TPA: hypothetical protein VG737_05080, partial [Cyclobacteriaceae bacterium]|nr:hypothetical protein [Cyclobacteriaceae bacterium]